ncbi:hypothetical protein HDG34_003208 [Paraburkholderia sp. HC6.4b]|uniref:hypothetical protein n=1 Tax=unclassified Paraburkholderia TaxID=2615204 RepID=UPI001611DDF4|nr:MULTISPECIES: hypothetical protein [unclassified Paraburkholderia]MBB5409267.1 hypothetical protein [Paraburkholderia sp. HC6.4b]MBB5450995.1 hypothetical protein [Paraburkholderia sp. Kb1A]
MIPNLYRYPLDLSGERRKNFVTGEPHAIGTMPVRVIAPRQGLFFGASVQIVDAFTQHTLLPLQYRFQFLHEHATRLTGKEVDAVIVITDPGVSPNVLITYQALGGEYGQPLAAITDEITALANDTRGVAFQDITNRPDTFPPVPHLHAIGDTYDWDYIVTAIEMLMAIVSLSETAAYDTVLGFIDQQVNLRDGDIANLAQQLSAHITNYSNPHQTTLAQLNMYSAAQVATLIASQTAAREAGDSALLASIAAHSGDLGNPHRDTAADIGGYTSEEANANLNTIVNALDATLAQDASAMAAHIADTDNPHEVTLAQIDGLTTAQINAVISTAMQPATTQLAAIESQLDTHITNYSNPHQTTLAQISGWDNGSIGTVNTQATSHISNRSNPHQLNVSQVGTLTGAQINANITSNLVNPANNSYLTPQANNINAHVGNFNNPHNTTVAMLGGWTYAQWQAALQAAINNLSYH